LDSFPCAVYQALPISDNQAMLFTQFTTSLMSANFFCDFYDDNIDI